MSKCPFAFQLRLRDLDGRALVRNFMGKCYNLNGRGVVIDLQFGSGESYGFGENGLVFLRVERSLVKLI